LRTENTFEQQLNSYYMDRDERRRLKEEMKNNRDDIRDYIHASGGNRVWSGLLLLAIGGLLMARQLGADIPAWMFHWNMLLIAIGLLISLKSGFRNAGGLITIIIGVAFLLNDIIPNAHMQDFIWPGILIIAGITFMLKPGPGRKHLRKWEKYQGDWKHYDEHLKTQITSEYTATQTNDNAEYIDINAVFGSVNKLILSKNFGGGEINAFMGGAEVNLLQADIKQTVQLEINNVFGGTKLIVPGNWDVKNEITAVFGGVEDKRNASIAAPDAGKIIILKGACVFGGIEIRNF
jgi:predicted membrane protein